MNVHLPKWLLRTVIVLGSLFVVIAIAGWFAARHFEPFVRQQALDYLKDKFGTTAELGDFQVAIRVGSFWKLETIGVRVHGTNLVLPYPHDSNLPPLARVAKFRVETGISALLSDHRRIREVRLEQVEINIPPKERRPPSAPDASSKPGAAANVVVTRIDVSDVNLNMFPGDPAKPPRLFVIHNLVLRDAGPNRPMKFQAVLTNPAPPGLIQTKGNFGPWQRDDPGSTAVSGDYTFSHADLGVFKRIAGILDSTGSFKGPLNRLEVDGETRTPDFRLTGGNPVSLITRYHSIVDGTSGDTSLEPVEATLGRTRMTARGSVTRPPGAKRRTVLLDVVMHNGQLEDVLRLAVKGNKPLMTGPIDLHTKLHILPLDEPFRAKLVLAGSFDMPTAHFLAANIQEKIDSLSRRAQGQPSNDAISDVMSTVLGGFNMRDGLIQFSNLTFNVPGAAIHLNGNYSIYSEQIDMHGVARLRAKVSQTQTGWKRLVLKPIDPFLSKNGAGTLLPIKITGTRQKPDFGLDLGHNKKEKESGENSAAAR